MGSYRSYQFNGSLDGALTKISGFVQTDSSGVPVNAKPPTVKGPLGGLLGFPIGVSAITRLQKGIIRITLEQPWIGIKSMAVMLYTPAASVQGTVLGTVDLTGVTLSTLNGLTVITTGDVGSLFTTTLTTPTSIANIAAQINAGNGGTSVVASIVTSITGAQYLKIVSTTLGASSSITVGSGSTAKTQLGLATTAFTGVAMGQLRCVGLNPRGVAIDYQPAMTVDFAYDNGAGVGLDLVSSAFWFEFWVHNVELGV